MSEQVDTSDPACRRSWLFGASWSFAAFTIERSVSIGIQSQRHNISLSCDKMNFMPY
jgi:hypothetical protein